MSDKRCEDCTFFQPIENKGSAVCLADDKNGEYLLILDNKGRQTCLYNWCGGSKYWDGDDEQ